MYKPRTIGQFKVWQFLESQFALEAFLVSPASRNGLMLEDRNQDQIAFEYRNGMIAECPLPRPGTRSDLRMFAEYLNHKCPEPAQQTFDAKTRLWLDSPIVLTHQQALGLNDALYRHYLTHPMLEKEDIQQLLVTGKISTDTYRSIQLWYLDGHAADTRLVISGVDSVGEYGDLIFHYQTPREMYYQFYILDE